MNKWSLILKCNIRSAWNAFRRPCTFYFFHLRNKYFEKYKSLTFTAKFCFWKNEIWKSTTLTSTADCIVCVYENMNQQLLINAFTVTCVLQMGCFDMTSMVHGRYKFNKVEVDLDLTFSKEHNFEVYMHSLLSQYIELDNNALIVFL